MEYFLYTLYNHISVIYSDLVCLLHINSDFTNVSFILKRSLNDKT